MQRYLLIAACVLAGLALGGGGFVGGVARAQTPSNDLSAVVAELRLLRQSVDEATRAQTQTQGLSAYLTAQQGRLVHTAGRLDDIRKDLDLSIKVVRDLSGRLAEAQQALARATAPREELEANVVGIKRALAVAADGEQRLRAREATLLEAYQQDETIWRDLIARLEQSIKR
jgi:hypothetical protein